MKQTFTAIIRANFQARYPIPHDQLFPQLHFEIAITYRRCRGQVYTAGYETVTPDSLLCLHYSVIGDTGELSSGREPHVQPNHMSTVTAYFV